MGQKLLINLLLALILTSCAPKTVVVPTDVPTQSPAEPEITIFPLSEAPEETEANSQSPSRYEYERTVACNWVEENTSQPTEFYPNGRTWAEQYPLTLVMKDDVLLGVNVRKAPYVTAPIKIVLSKEVRVLTPDGWQYFPQRIRVTEGEGGWLRIWMGWDTDYGLFIYPGWVHGSNFRMPTEDDPDYSQYLCY